MTLEYSHRNRGIIPGSTAPHAGLTAEMIRQLQQMISDGTAPEWLIGETEVEVTEGAVWDASISVQGEKATFHFTFPPGGVAWNRGALTTSSDIDSIRFESHAGVYRVTGTALATALNLPSPAPGTLTVQWIAGVATPITLQYWQPRGGPLYVRTISTTNIWSSWDQVSGWSGQVLPPGSDISHRRMPGLYFVPSPSAAQDIVGLPAPEPGTLLLLTSNGVQGTLRIYTAASIPARMWLSVLDTVSSTPENLVWSDWTPLHPEGGGSAGGGDLGAGHTSRVQRERQGTGTIGTDGRGVVAIRLDHNIKGTVEKVLPMLRERALPASQCHFVHQFDPQPGYTFDTSTGYDWADVQQYALEDGIEVWSHGWSHQDAPTRADLEREIIESRAEIEAQMPLVRVRGFMVPGTSGTFWGGFTNQLSDPSVWHATEAGRLVLSQYASANGGGGQLNPLAADARIGWRAHAIDSIGSATATINLIREAQESQTAAVIMVHPNMVDHPSGISSATLAEVLDYIADERDAGRLMVLTVWGATQADPERSTRHNLLRDTAFEDFSGRWAGTSGWTASDGVASTTSGGTFAQSFLRFRHSYAAGSSRELAFEVRATAGAVVRARVHDATDPATFDSVRDVTLPASSEWVTVRQPMVLPMEGSTFRTEIGRVSGGPVEIRRPGLFAI